MRMFDWFTRGITKEQQEEKERLRLVRLQDRELDKKCPACGHKASLHPSDRIKKITMEKCYSIAYCSCRLTQEQVLA